MYMEWLFPVVWIALAFFFALGVWKIGSGMHARAAAEGSTAQAQLFMADALRRLAAVAENDYRDLRVERDRQKAKEKEEEEWVRDHFLLNLMFTNFMGALETLEVPEEKWACVLGQDEELEEAGRTIRLTFHSKTSKEKIVVDLLSTPGEMPVRVQSCELLKFAGDHDDLEHLEGEACETFFENVEEAAERLAAYMKGEPGLVVHDLREAQDPLHDASSAFDETQTA